AASLPLHPKPFLHDVATLSGGAIEAWHRVTTISPATDHVFSDGFEWFWVLGALFRWVLFRLFCYGEVSRIWFRGGSHVQQGCFGCAGDAVFRRVW
ncbi:hypothetical protein A2U01_0071386, partial [Trifolium medium]|nr:hypothetical protein [Trifolium medium]